MINYYKTKDQPKLAQVLANKLKAGLKQGKVLWLVGGGSVMDVAVKTAKNLLGDPNLGNLTVTLTDERFGPVGHPDSNWQQLADKGFLLDGAKLLPILTGQELATNAIAYSQMLENEISAANYSVALGGMGTDGHILGIKPGSPAVDSQELVIGYKWDDYSRLTPTVQLLKRLDEVIIYAIGAEKYDQLDRIEQEVPPQEQPAQLLKAAKHVSIYNDYKGEML